MADAHFFTVAGDPRQAFTVVLNALAEQGFSIGAEMQPFQVFCERGSSTATVLAGAWAGKKNQHLTLQVQGVQENGASVIRLFPGSTGMSAGLIGVSRAKKAYTEIGEHVGRRLQEAGVLQAATSAKA